MRGRLKVAISLFILAASASPVWAGWACMVTPSPEPVLLPWGNTEAEARETSMRLCEASPEVQASLKTCRIFQCFPNVADQKEATDIWWRIAIKTFATPPK